ncbi:fimbria/pilus outer membrane usher protein [Proteus mirabilis]|nr:fimbria/pilus outer membrane usher protein [Proteus mirabilis]
MIHGLPAGWTIYGGTQLSKNYQAASIGVGKILGVLGLYHLILPKRDQYYPMTLHTVGNRYVFFIINLSMN